MAIFGVLPWHEIAIDIVRDDQVARQEGTNRSPPQRTSWMVCGLCTDGQRVVGVVFPDDTRPP